MHDEQPDLDGGAKLGRRPPAPIVPGTYSGQNSQNGNGVTFSVPAGGGRVLNFSIPRVNLVCVGGGGLSDQIRIEQVTIRPDRSFTATASQDGVSSGAKAKFTYFVSGTFEGFDRAGAPIAAGVYREDIAYADAHTARAPRTTRPGQRLGLDRGRATNRKGR